MDVKIKDASLIDAISPTVVFPLSDGSNTPKKASVAQLDAYLNAEFRNILDIAAFNSQTQYYANDIVRYENKAYRFIASHTGVWDSEDVEEITMAMLYEKSEQLKYKEFVSTYGALNLMTTATSSSWAAFKSYLSTRQTAGNYANYAPCQVADGSASNKIHMALVTYDSSIDALLWVYKDALYARFLGTATSKLVSFSASDAQFIHESFGKYNAVSSVTLTQGTSGKYVNTSGTETSNANYGISDAINLNMGDILLVPSASAVVAECSVVSQKETRTYEKPIVYTLTYDEQGRVATATSDYDPTLVYTYTYDEEGHATITIGGTTVASLPTTHTVTENFYVPLVRQSVAAMPSAGYYVYLAPQALTVVISGFTATVNGGVCKKVGWGIFKNIASNFVGALAQRTIAEAFSNLDARVAGIEKSIENGFASLSVQSLRVNGDMNLRLRGGDAILKAAGAPSSSVAPAEWDAERYGAWTGVPLFIGQTYFDTTNKVFYDATGVSAVTDWKARTNA
jgi:hypothetical protein